MATVKMGFSRKPIPKVLDECDGIVTSMTDNDNYPDPTPTLDVVDGSIKDCRTAYQNGLDGGKTLKATTRVKFGIVLDNMRQLAASVQTQSGGDYLTILSSGFGVRSAAGPKIKMAQVLNLRALPTTVAAQVPLAWAPVLKAKSYLINYTQTPAVEASWLPGGTSTKASATVTGLTSGVITWFRVAAIGPLGQGPWSDPAMKMVN